MKKKLLKSGYRIISFLLVLILLSLGGGFEVYAEEISEMTQNEDLQEIESPQETENSKETESLQELEELQTVEDSQEEESDYELNNSDSDNLDSEGPYTIKYDNTYAKVPFETKYNVSNSDTLVLPEAGDYLDRDGFILKWIWIWGDLKAVGYYPGSSVLIETIQSKLGDFTTLTIEPGYDLIDYPITYVLEPVDEDGNVIPDMDNPATDPENATFYDTCATIELKAPTKTGYTFEGWYEDAKYTRKVERIEPGRTGELTLYAKWRENCYTVIFDGNGGTAEIASKQVKYTETFTIPDATTTQTGYRLRNWIQKGTQQTYAVGESVSRLSATDNDEVTFVASYSNTFGRVQYILEPLDENGNPITDTDNPAENHPDNIYDYSFGDTFIFYRPTKTGYTFQGWYTDKAYTNQKIKITAQDQSDFILYAKWEENTYTLNLHMNDGTSAVSKYEIKYGQEFQFTTPSRSGYRFVYWNSDKTSKNGIFFDASESVSRLSQVQGDTLDFYAIWQKEIKSATTSSYFRGTLNSRWDSPIQSYLVSNSDGTLTRVEGNYSKIIVENYSASGQFINGLELEPELSKWGGFYSGEKYNFFAFGADNPDEDNEFEVMRIVRYSKDWKRLDSIAICAINTVAPFRAGSLAMTEMKDTLVVHTSRGMYVSSDGLSHQANMTFFIDTSKEEMIFNNEKNYSPGYCSHSFDQKLATNKEEVISADHGDAYPRAILLRKYSGTDGKGSSAVQVWNIPGATGDNYTGVNLGGIGISSTGYLVSANSVDFNVVTESPYSGQRNILVCYVPKDNFKSDAVVNKWITNYSSGVSVSEPALVKINDERFVLMWEENDEKVKYVYLDECANMIGNISTIENVHLSSGAPVVVGDKIIWYYTVNSTPKFYSIGYYNVSFSSEGGSEISDTFTIKSGEKYIDAYKRAYPNAVSFPEPTKTGYTFKGWYTKKEGGSKITEESKFNGSFDTILYARWENNKYKVSFDTGCEIELESITVTFDEPYGTLPTVERYGYEFLGWYTKEESGEEVTKDSIYRIDGDSILYARYKQVFYLTFDANGGRFLDENNVQMASQYTRSFGLTELPKEDSNIRIYWKNYTFTGWYTEKSGGTLFDFSKPLNMDMTVYAHYVYSVTISEVIANPGTENELDPGSKVSLSCETEGVKIYYYFDTEGRETSLFSAQWIKENGTLYENPIQLNESGILYVAVSLNDYLDEMVTDYIYQVKTAEEFWGDVSEEDRKVFEDATKVPKGLWVSKVKNLTYDGTVKKPELRVYFGLKRLKEKAHYTMTYKNNQKAGTATIVVKGKGVYTGTIEKQFQILPADLSKAKVKDVYLVEKTTSQKATSVVSIVLNSKEVKLKKGTDYELIYEDGEYLAPGTYTVRIVGKGNYEGSETAFREIIYPATQVVMDKLSVSKIKDQSYTGEAIILSEADLIVKKGREILTLGVDYEIGQYTNNTEIGIASVELIGTGERFIGKRVVTFRITGIPMSKVAVEKFEKNYVYTGKELLQNQASLLYYYKNEAGEKVSVTLSEGIDYEITYQKNVNAGTATVIYSGKGKYYGTIKRTYKIKPYDIRYDETTDKRISVKFDDKYVFMKNGVMAKPVVTYCYDGVEMVLVEGKDYTLSFKNQSVVTIGNLITNGKVPYVTINGKGNFSGILDRNRAFYYEIQKKDLSILTMDVTDIVAKEKAGICKPSISIYDDNGKKLTAGTDYDKTIVYKYTQDTFVKRLINGEKKTVLVLKGTQVSSADIIPQGTTILAVVNAKNTAQCGYYGTIEKTFRFVEADISKCSVSLAKSFTYHPTDVEFVINDFVVKNKQIVLSSEDYIIESYTINESNKTAVVFLAGTGKYGGKKKVTVKFVSLNFKDFFIIC